jgi:hypothetical protein
MNNIYRCSRYTSYRNCSTPIPFRWNLGGGEIGVEFLCYNCSRYYQDYILGKATFEEYEAMIIISELIFRLSIYIDS